MNYDMFILYARDDANFAKSFAKDLERVNIAVLYKECLPRPLGHTGVLKSVIEEKFKKATYGIVIISEAFFKLDHSNDDVEFLHDVVFMEHQILHPIWYQVSQAEVHRWNSKLGMGLALQCPPETTESMARKFQVKLAGSTKLQQNVLTGFHTQIQYKAPIISTYRSAKSSTSIIELPKESSPLPRELSDVSSVRQQQSLEDEQLDALEELQSTNINDMSIADCFDDQLRDEISKRLDVYLKDLANWKDLAAVFRIRSQDEIKRIFQTKLPTLSLIDLLGQLKVSLGEFKNACCKIERFDIVELLDKNIIAKGAPA